MLRVGLIQMLCEKGAIEDNLREIVRRVDEAATYAVELLAFPEMSLTGYIDPTRMPLAILDLEGDEVRRLLTQTAHSPAQILVGLIERNPGGKPFITQILIQRGKLLGLYRKVTIVDDEVAWFAPGAGDVLVACSGAHTIGVAICADIHNEQVFADCRRLGAELVVEVAAPGLYGEQALRNWQSGYNWWEGECRTWLGRYAQAHGLWVAVATQAGRTSDEDFPGGGFVFDPTGARLFTTGTWASGAAYLELDFEANKVHDLTGPNV
ncbi:MAG TPA: carbon-nitrogen hydrolase family protein [Anaerolineales bacterium]|nr:carbon-nitrogen hydrolase family protein [Anaerolineales bacterium]